MKRWHAVFPIVIGLLVVTSGAHGQRAPTPQRGQRPAVARGTASYRLRIQTAREEADLARQQARCLTARARKVDAAARRLNATHQPQARQARTAELDRELRRLDACYDVLFSGTSVAPAPAASVRRPPRRRSTHGHFGFGQIRVASSSVQPADLARPLRRRAERFRACYVRALKRAPELEGTVQLRLRLQKRRNHAMVTSVAVPNGTMWDAGVRKCLAERLMSTPFPAEAAGATVSLMMAFAQVPD